MYYIKIMSREKEMKNWMKEAYEAGKESKDQSLEEIVYSDAYPEWMFTDFNASVFFEAGRQGYDPPQYATGWRYGDVPASGRSMNYQSGCLEKGVSVMQLEGQDKVKTLAELRGSFDDRPKVRIGGWVNPIDVGGDGEPLLLACAKLV